MIDLHLDRKIDRRSSAIAHYVGKIGQAKAEDTRARSQTNS